MIHPGEILLEEYLKPMGISQNAMARAIGVSPRTVNEIVLGKRSITPQMSIRFGAFFGQSDEFWHRLQTEYNFRSLNKGKKKPPFSVSVSSSSRGSDSDRLVLRESCKPYKPAKKSQIEKSDFSDLVEIESKKYQQKMMDNLSKGDLHLLDDTDAGTPYKPQEQIDSFAKSDFNPLVAGDNAEISALRKGSTWYEAKAAGDRARAAEYEKVGFNFRVANFRASAAAWEVFASAVKQAKSETETETVSLIAEAKEWKKFGYAGIADECKKNAGLWRAVKPRGPAEVAGCEAYVFALKRGKTRAEAKSDKHKAEISEYEKSGHPEEAARRRNISIYFRAESAKQKKYIAELKKGKSKKEAEIFSWRAQATEYEKAGVNHRAAYFRARADMYEQGGSEEDIEAAGLGAFFRAGARMVIWNT